MILFSDSSYFSYTCLLEFPAIRSLNFQLQPGRGNFDHQTSRYNIAELHLQIFVIVRVKKAGLSSEITIFQTFLFPKTQPKIDQEINEAERNRGNPFDIRILGINTCASDGVQYTAF